MDGQIGTRLSEMIPWIWEREAKKIFVVGEFVGEHSVFDSIVGIPIIRSSAIR